jgi:hypothetical protein
MSDVIWIALLSSIPPTLTVALGFYAVYKKTDDLKVHINSKMDLLLKTSNDAKFAEGKLEGQKAPLP